MNIESFVRAHLPRSRLSIGFSWVIAACLFCFNAFAAPPIQPAYSVDPAFRHDARGKISGRTGLMRWTTEVLSVDRFGRPTQFLLASGAKSSVTYDESGDVQFFSVKVPAKSGQSQQKASGEKEYFVYALDPLGSNGPIRSAYGNRYTDISIDADGRYTVLTHGRLE
jgi:hypothetical protein